MNVFETYICLTEDEINEMKDSLWAKVEFPGDRFDFDIFVETYHKLLEAERRIANDKRTSTENL